VSIDAVGNIGELPGFIKYKSSSQTFTVSDASFSDFGEYSIGIQFGYVEYSFTAVCTVPLTVEYLAVFKGQAVPA
jgi:hypothetical protein